MDFIGIQFGQLQMPLQKLSHMLSKLVMIGGPLAQRQEFDLCVLLKRTFSIPVLKMFIQKYYEECCSAV